MCCVEEYERVGIDSELNAPIDIECAVPVDQRTNSRTVDRIDGQDRFCSQRFETVDQSVEVCRAVGFDFDIRRAEPNFYGFRAIEKRKHIRRNVNRNVFSQNLQSAQTPVLNLTLASITFISGSPKS